MYVLQVDEYMDQLPNHKVPRLSSPGEKYRDIQLIYQLPKQDLSRYGPERGALYGGIV